MSHPTLTTPPPLRGCDGADTFTFISIFNRLPQILGELHKHLQGHVPGPLCDAISALSDEIQANNPIGQLLARQPEPLWDSYTAPHVGKTWDQVPWFFAELYLYKRILDLCRSHHCGMTFDPFQYQKSASLEDARAAFERSVLPLAKTTV
jgi:hypothetical protein